MLRTQGAYQRILSLENNAVPYLFVQTNQSGIPLVETNPPRNNWPQTHQDDGIGGEADKGLASALKQGAHRIDRFADASKNS